MALVIQAHPVAEAPHSDRLNSAYWLWLPLAFLAALIWASHEGATVYDRIFNNERNGVMELAQALLMAGAFIVSLATIRPLVRMRASPWLYAWVALAALGSLYVAGEEISWGQHFFGWATPEGWSALNDQNETNLHNISAWFDQKPRHLLSAGVIVGGLVIPVLALFRPDIRAGRLGLILPPFLCLPSAALASFLGLAALFDDEVTKLFDGFSVVIRPSEAQETYFYSFILLYVVVLYRRVTDSTA